MVERVVPVFVRVGSFVSHVRTVLVNVVVVVVVAMAVH